MTFKMTIVASLFILKSVQFLLVIHYNILVVNFGNFIKYVIAKDSSKTKSPLPPCTPESE